MTITITSSQKAVLHSFTLHPEVVTVLDKVRLLEPEQTRVTVLAEFIEKLILNVYEQILHQRPDLWPADLLAQREVMETQLKQLVEAKIKSAKQAAEVKK